jgi:hypothetical protein
LLDQLSHTIFLSGVHASGRFVEDEKFRLQRECPGYFQAALIAVRQRRRSAKAMLLRIQPDGLQQLAGFFETPVIQTHQWPEWKQLPQGIVASAGVHPDQDVLDGGQVAIEAKGLKSPGDTEAGDRVR